MLAFVRLVSDVVQYFVVELTGPLGCHVVGVK